MPDSPYPRSYKIHLMLDEQRNKGNANCVAPINKNIVTRFVQCQEVDAQHFQKLAQQLGVDDASQLTYPLSTSVTGFEPADQSIVWLRERTGLQQVVKGKIKAWCKSEKRRNPDFRRLASVVHFLITRPKEVIESVCVGIDERETSHAEHLTKLIEAARSGSKDAVSCQSFTTEVGVQVPSSDGRERLRQMIESFLGDSPGTVNVIARQNGIAEKDATPASVARKIIESELPIDPLYLCVGADMSQDERKELNRSMPLLAGAVAPLCITMELFASLPRYLSSQDTGDVRCPVGTESPMLAAAAVGMHKGLAVHPEESDDFDAPNGGFPEAQGCVVGIPGLAPPESGAGTLTTHEVRTKNVVDQFRRCLHRLLPRCLSEDLRHVQSALRSRAKLENHVVVLFRSGLAEDEYNAIAHAFPQLVLLVSEESEEPPEHDDVRHAIKEVIEVFGESR